MPKIESAETMVEPIEGLMIERDGRNKSWSISGLRAISLLNQPPIDDT